MPSKWHTGQALRNSNLKYRARLYPPLFASNTLASASVSRTITATLRFASTGFLGLTMTHLPSIE